MTQEEVYNLLKSTDEPMTARQIRTALDDGKGWNVQYFCQKLYEKGCIHREIVGTRRQYRYWVQNGEKR
jgi:predicted transcriptional regulator